MVSHVILFLLQINARSLASGFPPKTAGVGSRRRQPGVRFRWIIPPGISASLRLLAHPEVTYAAAQALSPSGGLAALCLCIPTQKDITVSVLDGWLFDMLPARGNGHKMSISNKTK
jgi:hypothetical protein